MQECFRGILGQIFRWMGVDDGAFPNGTHDDADALSRVLFVVALPPKRTAGTRVPAVFYLCSQLWRDICQNTFWFRLRGHMPMALSM